MLWLDSQVEKVIKKISDKKLQEYLEELDDADIDYEVVFLEGIKQLIDYTEGLIRKVYCFSKYIEYIEEYIDASYWLADVVKAGLLEVYKINETNTYVIIYARKS